MCSLAVAEGFAPTCRRSVHEVRSCHAESVCGWQHLRVFEASNPIPVHATFVGKWSGVSLNASQGHERTVAVRPFAATSSKHVYRAGQELALQGHGGCVQPIRH